MDQERVKAAEGLVRQQVRGGVMVLMLDHPAANTLNRAMIAGLAKALDAALADPDIVAVLLTGAGRGFSAGMQAVALGDPAVAEALSRLALRIETLAKPVVAALHGTCLGAGLELAMACHWRIASADLLLGLPEIHQGLVPGSGGSQRLPRLIGGRQALRLLLDGALVPAAEALAMGLVDQVTEGDVLDAALAFAAAGPALRPTAAMSGRLADLFGKDGALDQARARVAGHRLPATARLVECVEAAALLPFEQGLALEAVAFADLALTDEALGLQAAWLAERRAAQVPSAIAALGVPRVDVLGLWSPPEGAVEMLVRALASGLRVILAAPDRDALVAVLNRVAARQDALVAEGRLDDLARDADWARLQPVMGGTGLAEADLILAAGDAPPEVPLQGRVVPGGLALGQSGIGLTLPDQPGGPAEIALGEGADPAIAARALALARRLGAHPVFAGPGGPILARLRRVLGLAISGLEQTGTDRALITQALAAFGMGTGPRSQLPAMPAGGAAILRACLAAMAAEGGRLLDTGAAHRPLDIDAVALHAGLLPRWEGGPMAWADRQGLLVLRADLWARAEARPALYAVPAVFDRLIAEGRPLAALNGRR